MDNFIDLLGLTPEQFRFIFYLNTYSDPISYELQENANSISKKNNICQKKIYNIIDELSELSIINKSSYLGREPILSFRPIIEWKDPFDVLDLEIPMQVQEEREKCLEYKINKEKILLNQHLESMKNFFV